MTATTRSGDQRPARPIRRVSMRLDAAAGRFVPCPADDPRASLIERFDAHGRTVISDRPGAPRLGYENRCYEPAEVRAWIEAEAQRRRTTTRRDK